MSALFGGELFRLRKRFHDLRHESLPQTMRRGVDKVFVHCYAPLAKHRSAQRTFSFMGELHSYVIHSYNATWRNERAVEVALGQAFLRKIGHRRLLELGNVMSYYADQPHDVVDKYEDSPGVMNVDFPYFRPAARYDAFLSISTFEHIGWDEAPRQPHKVGTALRHIASVISAATPTDDIFVTFPLGYNNALDELVASQRLSFPKQGALVRVSASTNEWVETHIADALGRPYASRFPAANALYVGYGVPHLIDAP